MGMSDKIKRIPSNHNIKSLVEEQKYVAVDAFSGPGGMSLGIGMAGFDVISAFDIDEASVATYRRNLGEHGGVADVREVSGRELLRSVGLEIGQLDLFAGGPPCQGFSKQKRGAHLGDSRNDLVLEFIRLVGEMKPRAFFFENVKIFGQKRGRDYVSAMVHELRSYDIIADFYNSAHYGLAQTRERFVAVGLRDDQAVSYRKPLPTTERPFTVGQVIGDLPEPPEDYVDHPDYPNHQRARVTSANIFRFTFVPQGGGWRDIPIQYQLACHRNVETKSGGWPDVYGRLEWDGQCPTITGGFDSFTRGRYGHPLQHRPLTPREAARIQGFPDKFVFTGTRADIRSQIGNAVPPPLSEAIALEIAHALLRTDGVVAGEYRQAKRDQLELFVDYSGAPI